MTIFNGNSVSYDMDGNMLFNGYQYDSANRLIAAAHHVYTYNAEDIRIRTLNPCDETTYTYNTNCKLSQLLTKTTDDVTTKYVYGLDLIGEEEQDGGFKTYHFDYRGSTVAITDECGNITDTFKYDTYGKMTGHSGSSNVIFGYNGRDGVITDDNGLIYMRARYYSPAMRRFVNADIIPGEISNAVTLNRYAYANGNPVSNVDPFGLAAEERSSDAIGLDDFRNPDGTYSLHDNHRRNPNNVFHEQIFVITASGPSFDLKEGDVGIGSVQGDFTTGGWEWKYADLSLLDFGHVEAGAEIKDGKIKYGAFASAWSPSFTIKLFGIEIEIGVEVGAIGAGTKASSQGVSINLAYMYGATVSVSW